jgi:CheY-like chemotaxis protein
VGNARILLVEDDPNDAFLLQRAFEKAEVKVPIYIARDGQETIDYLHGVGPFADRAAYPLPTLLLLDIEMPRLNGLEVLAWLRQDPEWRHLPVVILTASWESEDMRRAHALGATGYHVKPQEPAELNALVELFDRCWLHTKRPVPAPQPAASQRPMRVLLRNMNSGRYFQSEGQWADDPKEALDLQQSTSALTLARAMNVGNLEVLYEFNDGRVNVRLPMPR